MTELRLETTTMRVGSGTSARRAALLALCLSFSLAVGCASGSSSTEEGPGSSGTATMAPPPGHPLAKITTDMYDLDVIKIMGQPASKNTYRTWQSWVPFFNWGTDQSRTVYNYPSQGRVVFTRNQYTGTLKVVRVEYNPNL